MIRPRGGGVMSLRNRVLLLVGLAALPLVLLAALVIWRDYRSAREAPLARAALLRSAILSGERGTLDAAAGLLGRVAAMPDVGEAAGCRAALEPVWRLHPGAFQGLVVLDAAGRPVCHLPDPLPLPLPSPPLAATLWLSGAGPEAAEAPVAVAAAGPAGGVVVGWLRRAWLARRIQGVDPSLGAWLTTPDGALVMAETAGRGVPSPETLPPETLRTLLAGAGVTEVGLPDGRLAVYAAGRLSGLVLIIGHEAGPAADGAWSGMERRAAVLALLLAAVIVLGAMGANHLVAAPARRLAAAVRAWRAGAPFRHQPGTLPGEFEVVAESLQAAATRLAEREAELQRATTRQELLLKEVHHRVKNNLQVVASLLNLQASRLRQPEARAAFQSARDRVRALSTLHRHLYIQGELHTINMRGFLRELCGQLFQAMGEAEGARIGLEVEAPEVQMLSDQAVPLALIVTEAVGNALKYAFPDGRAGHVTVRLDAAGESARLIIQDDGVGIPAGRAETEAGPRDGLGLQLIRGFARQLGAVLTVDQGSGTRYVVEMPLHRPGMEESLAAEAPAAPG